MAFEWSELVFWKLGFISDYPLFNTFVLHILRGWERGSEILPVIILREDA